jgi:uncharacterized protein
MQVEHDSEHKRFVVWTAAGGADLRYEEPRPGVLDLLHTFVPRDSRGEGIAESLAESALQYARDQDMRVIPTCGFVQKWIDANPEYSDLVVT